MRPRDAFGYSLSYYDGDYTPVGQGNTFLASLTSSALDAATPSLYNGNIRHMVTSLTDLINDPLDVQGTAYKYDQLNRLTHMQAHVGITTNEWDASGTQLNIYGVDTITFDPNGNILTLKRLGNQTGTPIMDTLTYHYYGNTNRLEYVTDTVNPVTYSNDIDNQSADNYAYDAIGNLISDVAEGITAIEWYVNGKIKGITRSSATQSRPHLAFSYGPDGQRIRKVATWSTGSDTTWYVRDAQGNPMAVYWQRNDSLFAKEHYLYGSSRLGSIHDSTFVTTLDPHSDTNRYARTLGLKYFELSNHLGNVLATVSDQKISVEKSGSVEYYLPKVVSYSDYYPFGMQMEGRSGGTDYRFGFNGQERDNEVSGDGNSYTAEFWQYDSRLGRRWNRDPIIKHHESPYATLANNPIWFIDPFGLDTFDVNQNSGDFVNQIETLQGDDVFFIVDDEMNRIGEPFVLEEGSLEKFGRNSYQDPESKEIKPYLYLRIRGDIKSSALFEFFANNTKVEWSQTLLGESGESGLNYLSTTHNEYYEGGGAYLFFYQFRHGYTIRGHNHNHPFGTGVASESDISNVAYIKKWAKGAVGEAVFKVYRHDTNKYYLYDENDQITPPDPIQLEPIKVIFQDTTK